MGSSAMAPTAIVDQKSLIQNHLHSPAKKPAALLARAQVHRYFLPPLSAGCFPAREGDL